MKNRRIDLLIVCFCLAVMGIVLAYPEDIRGETIILVLALVCAVIFLFLAVRDKDGKQESFGQMNRSIPSDSELITEIVLLSEEDTELLTWDLYGKTAMVIGRDVKENQVDIDLGRSPYASMVEIEHAVLNFSGGNWYVEDLGSSNGISVKKEEDGRTYKLSSDTPCRLERGDCLYIGLNRLILK